MTGVAVITGAASGIGAGLARAASARGLAVVLADWNSAALEGVAGSLDGDVAFRRTDVRAEADLTALADLAYDRFGRVDMLFNNAGVLSSGRIWELDAETWKRSFDVNVLGVVNGLRAFVPRLIEAQRPARIINTASVGGFFASPLMSPYSASKAAVVSLTEALVQELSKIADFIDVSLLAPGPVKTGILSEQVREESSQLVEKMREMSQQLGADPDEYARLIFEAIDRKEFWIVPQPQSLDPRIVERAKMILARRTPGKTGKKG
jgi:NAD(P)-dependent dehydrogenase (short-subunit alcohol dehydrogenase family)